MTEEEKIDIVLTRELDTWVSEFEAEIKLDVIDDDRFKMLPSICFILSAGNTRSMNFVPGLKFTSVFVFVDAKTCVLVKTFKEAS